MHPQPGWALNVKHQKDHVWQSTQSVRPGQFIMLAYMIPARAPSAGSPLLWSSAHHHPWESG